jgi:hypothetical protein
MSGARAFLRLRFAALVFALAFTVGGAALAQGVAVADAEAARCEERIASVKRDVLGKYEDALAELQTQFQKAGDLENALAVRAERERARKEGVLTEAQFATEPKSLRALQQAHIAKMRELIAALVGESVPKLVEMKKQLTIAGRLDEAVSVRSAIERLQNDHLPIAKPESGATLPVNDLLTAYGADRTRADKTYKGQKLVVRGMLGGFRQDPADPKHYLVFLTRSSGGGWVQCAFNGDARCREEKQFNTTFLIVTGKDGEQPARLQTGQTVDIRGTCEGFEEVVRMTKCEIAR